MKGHVAVVGVGYWGRNLARNFSELGALHALCDSSAGNLDEIHRLYGGTAEPDYSRLLEDPAVEAVVLATPAETHYRLGRMALEAGRHLYVEKPLALKEAHAAELVEKAEKAGLILMVGHQHL